MEIVFFGGEPFSTGNWQKKIIKHCENNILPEHPDKS
jgi:hypothetical protein